MVEFAPDGDLSAVNEELMEFTWRLYEMVYEFLGQDISQSVDPVTNEFKSGDINVTTEQLQIVLCAMGNVIGALTFRDEELRKYFRANMERTWKIRAEDAKRIQQ